MRTTFKILFFIPLITGLLWPSAGLYPGSVSQMPGDSVHQLSFIFVGDVMQHQTQLDAARDPLSGKYEYDSCFKYVRSMISSYDIAVANLEVTLGGEPYTGYPQFSAPDELAAALKRAGFDYLVTANNHSCDRGKNGIIRTVQTLDALQIPHTGTFKDSNERNASYPLIIRKNGIKVALLNYTYGTNGIAVPAPTIVNLIDTLQMAKDLARAHDSLPDKIIMMIHWGDEYQSHPNEYQQSVADFCFRHGTDILIGSHPHVIQRMERKFFPDSSGREVLLVYSLGNYISNQRDRYKDGGASITFSLTKEHGHTEISRAGYELTWVWIPVVDGRKHYYIVPVRQAENSTIVTDSASLQKMNLFINDSRRLYGKWNVGVEAVDVD